MAGFDNTKGRKQAAKEVDDDLNKDYRWLLIDIHDELLFNYIHHEEIAKGNAGFRSNEENMLHAQKRLASLQVKIAMGADALQTQMRRLMWASIIVSIIAVVIALIALFNQSTAGC